MKKASIFYPRKRVRLRWAYIALLICTICSAAYCFHDLFMGQIILLWIGGAFLFVWIVDIDCNHAGILLLERHVICKRPFRKKRYIDECLAVIAIVPEVIYTKYGIHKAEVLQIQKDGKKIQISTSQRFRLCLLVQTDEPPELQAAVLENQYRVKDHNRSQFMIDLPLTANCLLAILSRCDCPIYIKQTDLNEILPVLSEIHGEKKCKMKLLDGVYVMNICSQGPEKDWDGSLSAAPKRE